DEKGKIIGTIGTSVDITKQKKLEKNLKEQIYQTELANHTKDEFLSIMTHEMGSPIANVCMLTEVIKTTLQKDNALDKISDNLDHIYEQAQDALSRIKKVRRYLALEQKGITHDVTRCDIGLFITNIIQHHKPNNSVQYIIENNIKKII